MFVDSAIFTARFCVVRLPSSVLRLRFLLYLAFILRLRRLPGWSRGVGGGFEEPHLRVMFQIVKPLLPRIFRVSAVYGSSGWLNVIAPGA